MATNRYFFVSHGLRGCYMPDNSQAVMCQTRRELKDTLESTADYLRDGSTVGLSKRAIAWLAARAWREAGKKGKREYLPFVAPYRDMQQSHYPYGLFCSVTSRAEYLENRESDQ